MRYVAFLAMLLMPMIHAVEVEQTIDIAPVWSGHPVGFALLTHPPHQFVAFYAADRAMTVGMRKLDAEDWTFATLPEAVGWDSHNSIVMAVDDDGYLHLSGNMHVHPLKYFRTTRPLDVNSFERATPMVGTEENRATYPSFFRGPDKALLFTYRDGHSGAANQIYNVYDRATRTWSRLLDKPLVDGGGKMNAYFSGPQLGPDGRYHLCWVWRDTGDCATNHDLSYARSKDLRHWETSQGEPLELPITFATCEVVDPVPPGGGIINGNARMGFDHENRVTIAYHKYDEDGNTQVYNARLEDDGWRIYQSSNYDYRWAFGGGGSINFEVRVYAIQKGPDGTISQVTGHQKRGNQHWRLDPDTLAPVERLPMPPANFPKSMYTVSSEFPGMSARIQGDSGTSGEKGIRYAIGWETLGPNRDRPREKPWPEPTMLRVYRLRDGG